jgi:hypothetical protein
MRTSRFRGAPRLRRLMQRMPAAVQAEIVEELGRGGGELEAEMERRAPFRTGSLRGGISHKVFAKTMKLRVGLLGTKRGRAKLFYGYIQDVGRKAQTVRVTRRMKAGGAPYLMRVKAMAPKKFVTGSFRDIRMKLSGNLKQIWARALARVGGGGE